MTYQLQYLRAHELPSDFMMGELLLTKASNQSPDFSFFVFLGQVGESLRLGRVRFDKKEHRVETTEEITVPSNQRGQFSRLPGLVAVAA